MKTGRYEYLGERSDNIEDLKAWAKKWGMTWTERWLVDTDTFKPQLEAAKEGKFKEGEYE